MAGTTDDVAYASIIMKYIKNMGVMNWGRFKDLIKKRIFKGPSESLYTIARKNTQNKKK